MKTIIKNGVMVIKNNKGLGNTTKDLQPTMGWVELENAKFYEHEFKDISEIAPSCAPYLKEAMTGKLVKAKKTIEIYDSEPTLIDPEDQLFLNLKEHAKITDEGVTFKFKNGYEYTTDEDIDIEFINNKPFLAIYIGELESKVINPETMEMEDINAYEEEDIDENQSILNIEEFKKFLLKQ